MRCACLAGMVLLLGGCTSEGPSGPDPRDLPFTPGLRQPLSALVERPPNEPLAVDSSLVFAFSRVGEIMFTNGDGTKLAGPIAQGYNPDWSRRGTLAFECGDHICTIDPNGTQRLQITRGSSMERGPDWNPSGRELAFVSYDCTIPDPWEGYSCVHEGLSISGADGTGRVTLSMPPTVWWVEHPDWSPDGTRIAFSCRIRDGRPLSFLHVCVARRDGSGFQQLTDGMAHDTNPVWSPDGRVIAFQHGKSSEIEHPYEITLMDPDGRNVRPLGAGVFGQFASWSSDGGQIAFTGYAAYTAYSGIGGVHVVNADGTGLSQLTQRSDYAPVWRPR